MVSEDQLMDRDEAIAGDDAEHIVGIEERGDTAINTDQIPEEEEIEVRQIYFVIVASISCPS